MQPLVECVPNFSEGRDAQRVEAIVQALLDGPEVYLLDKEMDADHNRSVITIVGTPEGVGEAALRGIGKAAELIDLNGHRGGHPRIGATDVVPFVPVEGVTLNDCVRIAERVAAETWRHFHIPTYLYEAAARAPERRNLENIRRGQFEGLREEIRTKSERRPDFGDAAVHPTAGATVVGARKFLIAYNINLGTDDLRLAKSIAQKIRASSGGFPCVKAMGVPLERKRVQVSINLTDFETTPISVVFDAVAREAASHDVAVEGSEVVGLVPRRALEDAAVRALKIERFYPEMIFENRLARVLESSSKTAEPSAPASAGPLRSLTEKFLTAVRAATPTPGGGSVSALAGALAAALGEMAARLTLARKSYAGHQPALEKWLARLSELSERLLDNIDRDAQSYEQVIAAKKLPKSTAHEQASREDAIEIASKRAATVPLETAELAVEVNHVIEALRAVTLRQAASDLAVALHLARAAEQGALENVRANLDSIRDREWVSKIQQRLDKLSAQTLSENVNR